MRVSADVRGVGPSCLRRGRAHARRRYRSDKAHVRERMQKIFAEDHVLSPEGLRWRYAHRGGLGDIFTRVHRFAAIDARARVVTQRRGAFNTHLLCAQRVLEDPVEIRGDPDPAVGYRTGARSERLQLLARPGRRRRRVAAPRPRGWSVLDDAAAGRAAAAPRELRPLSASRPRRRRLSTSRPRRRRLPASAPRALRSPCHGNASADETHRYLESEFVLSPQGKGRACFREWEAMLAGAVGTAAAPKSLRNPISAVAAHGISTRGRGAAATRRRGIPPRNHTSISQLSWIGTRRPRWPSSTGACPSYASRIGAR